VLRQRLRTRTSPLAYVSRVIPVIVALVLIWYGLMLLLLALKFSPDTVNSISGYRTIYDELAGIGAGDISDRSRLIAGIAGLVAFLLFGLLALKEFPRPYLTRSESPVQQRDELGEVVIEPRAVERVAETAAQANPAVTGAAGRYGDEQIYVNVKVKRARAVPETLRDVQRRVAEAMGQHGLPAVPVNVTLAGFDRQQRRELN